MKQHIKTITRWQRCVLAVSLLTGVGALLPLTGCGGGGGSWKSTPAVQRSIGAISLTIKWPEPSRLVPDATQSIVITLRQGANVLDTRTVNRPTDFPPIPVPVTFAGLNVAPQGSPAIEYTIEAVAFPQNGGGGTPLARGAKTFGLTAANPAASDRITMGSTITRIEITPLSGPRLRIGDTRQLTATAYDASGDIVLTTPGRITWTVSRPGVGTITPNPGNPVTFTVTGAGSTEVSVRDADESNVASTVPAIVETTDILGVDGNSNWARFHGNAQSTGAAKGGGSIAGDPVQRWMSSAGSSVEFASPIVAADGSVYVGSMDGKLYAFSSTGALKWTYQTDAEIQGTPVLAADGSIYFGSMDGFVYSVKDRGTSAEEQWKTNTGAPIFGSVNLDKQSFLYVASGTTVHRIDGLTGTRIWARDTGATLQTSPALNSAETLLFVSSTDGQVFAVSSVGTLVWTRATNYKNYSSSPVVGSNGGVETVYVGTVDETGGGYLFALDASSGAINWSFDAEAPIYSTPAVSADGSTVYVASFDNVTGNNWSRVFAVDAATGNKIWPLDNPDPLDPSQLIPDTFFPDGFVSSPALSSDGTQLYIGCYDGKLYSISLATGMVTGSFDTNSGGGSVNNIDSSVGIGSDGAIYFGTFNGEVYALSQ